MSTTEQTSQKRKQLDVVLRESAIRQGDEPNSFLKLSGVHITISTDVKMIDIEKVKEVQGKYSSIKNLKKIRFAGVIPVAKDSVLIFDELEVDKAREVAKEHPEALRVFVANRTLDFEIGTPIYVVSWQYIHDWIRREMGMKVESDEPKKQRPKKSAQQESKEVADPNDAQWIRDYLGESANGTEDDPPF